MARYILDTNHLSAAVKPGSVIRRRIRQVQEAGSRVGSCIPVLCELEVGASQVGDPDLYRKILRRFLAKVPITTDRDFEALPSLRKEDWT